MTGQGIEEAFYTIIYQNLKPVETFFEKFKQEMRQQDSLNESKKNGYLECYEDRASTFKNSAPPKRKITILKKERGEKQEH